MSKDKKNNKKDLKKEDYDFNLFEDPFHVKDEFIAS